jgi:hypothetical protein
MNGTLNLYSAAGSGQCMTLTGVCYPYTCATALDPSGKCPQLTNVCACETNYCDGTKDDGKKACCGAGCPIHRDLALSVTKPEISCQTAHGPGVCAPYQDSCCDSGTSSMQSCYEASTQDCCASGPGKGKVCPKGRCGTRPGYICD